MSSTTRDNAPLPAPPGFLDVDLAALAENYRIMGKCAQGTEVAAAVKARAYGLGGAAVAGALWKAGCTRFFVATIAEGTAIRGVVPSAEIFVLNGLLDGDEAPVLAHELIPVLNDMSQVARWREQGAGAPAAVHVDTGINRLGLSMAEAEALAADRGDLEIALLMSHLACAGQPGHPMNAQQLDRFRHVGTLFPDVPKSLANSAGAQLGPDYHFDLVRAGIGLYGGNPAPGRPNPFKPVVTLHARVLQQRWLEPPASVGYEALYTVDGRIRLATVAAGYADGLPTTLTNRGKGFVAGHHVPMVGRVSMDLITLDVTAVPEAETEPGCLIELLGPHVLVDDVAEAGGLISYELLTGLGPRFQRRYTGS